MTGGQKLNVGQSQTAWSPQNYSNPFGSFQYGNGGFQVNPSQSVGQGISSRQQMINDLIPQVNTTNQGQQDQIKNYQDVLTSQLNQNSLPQMWGQMAGRGLDNSTAATSGLQNLLRGNAQQGILGANDLYNQALQRQLQSGQFLQGGLNDAYQQMMGIGQQGMAGNQMYQNWQNQNANSMMQGNEYNNHLAQQNLMNMYGGMGNLAGMGMGMLSSGGPMNFMSQIGQMDQGMGNGFNSLFNMGGNTGNLNLDSMFQNPNIGSSMSSPKSAFDFQSMMPFLMATGGF